MEARRDASGGGHTRHQTTPIRRPTNHWVPAKTRRRCRGTGKAGRQAGCTVDIMCQTIFPCMLPRSALPSQTGRAISSTQDGPMRSHSRLIGRCRVSPVRASRPWAGTLKLPAQLTRRKTCPTGYKSINLPHNSGRTLEHQTPVVSINLSRVPSIRKGGGLPALSRASRHFPPLAFGLRNRTSHLVSVRRHRRILTR